LTQINARLGASIIIFLSVLKAGEAKDIVLVFLSFTMARRFEVEQRPFFCKGV